MLKKRQNSGPGILAVVHADDVEDHARLNVYTGRNHHRIARKVAQLILRDNG